MNKQSRFYIKLGRILSGLSVIAFVLTWFVGAGEIMGMNQSHLFNDAIVLALFSIICLIDGFLHTKEM